MKEIEEFKKKKKFIKDSLIDYPGIAEPSLRPILNQKINLVADDFRKIIEGGNGTDIEYQDKIKIGLERFEDVKINLDTEDLERICHYFEELMDIVDLESSGGLLNDFMYGFDPTSEMNSN